MLNEHLDEANILDFNIYKQANLFTKPLNNLEILSIIFELQETNMKAHSQ